MPRFLDKDEALGWIREHGQRLNAGDASAVLWESPYDSAYSLWLRKTKRIPPKEQTEQMQSGVNTEPLIFAWYQKLKGITGESQIWCAYSEAEWIQGKADFWDAETRHLAEFKTRTKEDAKAHEIAKAGMVPYPDWLQCQHLFQTFDALTMDYVSWFSPTDAVMLPVKRDDDFWAMVMLPAYMEFQRRVEENAWPKPEGKTAIEDEEWAMQAHRFLDGRGMKREAEAYIDRAEAALKRMADGTGAKTIAGGGIRATWTTYKPRWEAVVSADSQEALTAILKALEPLEDKQGVGKISKRAYPPNLVLRISEQMDKSEGEL
jgi:YqaJ-like viral recombinase domain